MRWYKAEIKGEGREFDGACWRPDEKVICLQFQAKSDEEARERAMQFARGEEIRKEYWFYDINPEVSITAFLNGDEPTEERHWLAN